MRLTWDDVEDIAEQLGIRHPDVDPLGVRFTDLHRWVCELPDFADDPKASSDRPSTASRRATSMIRRANGSVAWLTSS